ncbi:MAG: replicative DNA helicase [Thermodesulfobacteriota bacterium]
MSSAGLQVNKDPSFQKLPPQSIEAEESLISAVLLDNSTLLDILEVVSPDDFYKSAHQKIFAAITDLFSEDEPVDLVTLAERLKKDNQLESVGGAVYLAKIVDTAPVPANAKNYATIVRDKATLRRMITTANDIVQRCYEQTGNIDEVIDNAESSLLAIAEQKLKQNVFPISKIIEANIDALEERQGNKSLMSGVPSGFKKLDEMTSGFQPSDLIILAARPGMGKTALALNLARYAAVEGEIPVAVFSLEMSKEQLSLRLLCSEARINSARVRDCFFNDDDWYRLTNAAGVLSGAPIFIDDSPDLSTLDVKTKARRLKREKNLGMILIDYLQLMRPGKTMERRELEISEMSRTMKGLAKELGIPVIALSQLNRRLEERSDKRPQLSDLRESGALEQDADLVMFIYRDDVYNTDENNPNKNLAELHLAKQRNGPTGMCPLVFKDEYTRFENMAYGDYSPDPALDNA